MYNRSGMHARDDPCGPQQPSGLRKGQPWLGANQKAFAQRARSELRCNDDGDSLGGERRSQAFCVVGKDQTFRTRRKGAGNAPHVRIFAYPSQFGAQRLRHFGQSHLFFRVQRGRGERQSGYFSRATTNSGIHCSARLYSESGRTANAACAAAA